MDCLTVNQLDGAVFDVVSYEVIAYVNVSCSFLRHVVVGNCHARLVVFVDRNWELDFDTHGSYDLYGP